LHIIGARVRILDRWSRESFPDVPHFWVQPVDGGVRDFLRRYSECGGTHHLALVVGDHMEAVRRMAEMLGLDFESV
jgi:L-arabinose isomerase